MFLRLLLMGFEELKGEMAPLHVSFEVHVLGLV